MTTAILQQSFQSPKFYDFEKSNNRRNITALVGEVVFPTTPIPVLKPRPYDARKQRIEKPKKKRRFRLPTVNLNRVAESAAMLAVGVAFVGSALLAVGGML